MPANARSCCPMASAATQQRAGHGGSSIWLVCTILALLLLPLATAVPPPRCLTEDQLASVVEGALTQLQAFAEQRQSPTTFSEKPTELAATPLPSMLFPNGTDPQSGLWIGTKPSKWTSGYLAGCYWLAYDLTGDQAWADLAEAELPGLKPVALETDNHRVSHIFDSSYGEALRAGAPGVPVEEYQIVMQTAAASLSARFNDKVGMVQSWYDIGEDFVVIMDSMAALKIMFEAAAMPGGKSQWAAEALSHARRVSQDHFRASGRGTYHGARYDADSGKLLWRGTFQGYADNSTWARGQAWAVVGFTHVANITGEAGMLAAARRAADYFILRLKEAADGVPLWDFDVPLSAKEPWKDSSAAAIAASGLLRLGELSGEEQYSAAGAALLSSLAGSYLGWEAGKEPWQEQKLASLLRNGTCNVPKGLQNTGPIYGDYYFLDALNFAQQHNLTSSCDGL